MAGIDGVRLETVDHPYYTTGQYEETYASWEDFFAEFGDVDEDYNLVFRADVRSFEEDKADYDGDDGYEPSMKIIIGMVVQRKGFTSSHTVSITEDDMPAIRAYLQSKYDYLKTMWTPFSDAPIVFKKENA